MLKLLVQEPKIICIYIHDVIWSVVLLNIHTKVFLILQFWVLEMFWGVSRVC